MLRALRTSRALLRAECNKYTAAAAYSALPQPQTTPDVLYTGVSTQQFIAQEIPIFIWFLLISWHNLFIYFCYFFFWMCETFQRQFPLCFSAACAAWPWQSTQLLLLSYFLLPFRSFAWAQTANKNRKTRNSLIKEQVKQWQNNQKLLTYILHVFTYIFSYK